MDSDGVTVSLPHTEMPNNLFSIGEKWMVLHYHDQFRLRMLKFGSGTDILLKCRRGLCGGIGSSLSGLRLRKHLRIDCPDIFNDDAIIVAAEASSDIKSKRSCALFRASK